MITYKTGNILEANTEAVVNTVNTVGVMGKGIALQFKRNFPDNFKAYKAAVGRNEVETGKMFIYPNSLIENPKFIVNFPTKEHWRNASEISWIDEGLQDLRKRIPDLGIKSIAIPPLGCGQGGLNWSLVKPLIISSLKDLDIEIVLYEPSEKVKQELKKQTDTSASKLTDSRAMLLTLLYNYRSMGEEASEFASEKLCYFLQLMGETQLDMDFVEGHYGPYSGKVRFLLDAVNGYYIKGMEQMDVKPFEALELVVEKKPEVEKYIKQRLTKDQKAHLEKLSNLIDGFQTTYGLELLATVDFIRRKYKVETPEEISSQLSKWSHRKAELFPLQHVQIANDHLQGYFKY
jgi:O-acetyl-ADP-ribose deacetylase (regulator of RNase III)